MTFKNERSFHHFLQDIDEAMTKIENYTKEINSFQVFIEDPKTIDAVIRNFEVIGEATKNIPKYIKEENEAVPWQRMYVLRNILTHEYFGIDYKILWEIATVEMPSTHKEIKILISNLEK